MPTSSQCLILLTSGQTIDTSHGNLISHSRPKTSSNDTCLDGPIPICSQSHPTANIRQTVGPTVVSIRQSKSSLSGSTKQNYYTFRGTSQKKNSSGKQGRQWYHHDNCRTTDDYQCSIFPKSAMHRRSTEESNKNQLIRRNVNIQPQIHRGVAWHGSYSEFRLPEIIAKPKTEHGEWIAHHKTVSDEAMVEDFRDKSEVILQLVSGIDIGPLPCGTALGLSKYTQTPDAKCYKDEVQGAIITEYHSAAEYKRLSIANDEDIMTSTKSIGDGYRGMISGKEMIDILCGATTASVSDRKFKEASNSIGLVEIAGGVASGQQSTKTPQGETHSRGSVDRSQGPKSDEVVSGTAMVGICSGIIINDRDMSLVSNLHRPNHLHSSQSMQNKEKMVSPKKHKEINCTPEISTATSKRNLLYETKNLATLAKILRKKLKVLSVRLRTELPPLRPMAVCFNMDENALNHSDIKKTIENRIGVSPTVLQYEPISDYRSNLGTVGRWVATFTSKEFCEKLATEGMHMYGKRIWVRPYDSVVKEEYEAYRLYRMVIESQSFRREAIH